MNNNEAWEVGRTESMRAADTNTPKRKSYEKIMRKRQRSNSFYLSDKSTRTHLLECLRNTPEIDRWRDPDGSPADPIQSSGHGAPQMARGYSSPRKKLKAPAPMANLKAANIELQKKLDRAERKISADGGDLTTPDHTPEDIATVMVVKLSPNNAERVEIKTLTKLNNKKTAPPKITTKQTDVGQTSPQNAMKD